MRRDVPADRLARSAAAAAASALLVATICSWLQWLLVSRNHRWLCAVRESNLEALARSLAVCRRRSTVRKRRLYSLSIALRSVLHTRILHRCSKLQTLAVWNGPSRATSCSQRCNQNASSGHLQIKSNFKFRGLLLVSSGKLILPVVKRWSR